MPPLSDILQNVTFQASLEKFYHYLLKNTARMAMIYSVKALTCKNLL